MQARALKLNKDFKRLYYRGKSVVKPNIVVYISKNRFKNNRLGLTCGKSIGNAVKRNRAKRLMRESYRLMESSLKIGYDIVIVARNRAVGKTFFDINKDVESAFSKLGLFEE